MFKFNFSDNSDDEGQMGWEKTKKNHEINNSTKVLNFKEIHQNHSFPNEEKKFIKFTITDDVFLEYIDSTTLFENNSLKGSNAYIANKNNSDLISSIYEGGIKVWECTKDLLVFFLQSHVSFDKCAVLDLGCGQGLLGIYALLQGASEVHFQDYNEEVILSTTMPNVCKALSQNNPISKKNSDNEDEPSSKSSKKRKIHGGKNESVSPKTTRFFAGDWSEFHKNFTHRYDYIFTSETIYNVDNYGILHFIFQKFLKPDGICFIAAKNYYFGVGGSTKEFLDYMVAKSIFEPKTVKVIPKGVQREIIQLKFKKS